MYSSSKTFGYLHLLFAICLFVCPAEAKYGGGKGEPNDPYLIYTAEQMNAIGTDPNDWDKHFKLMADINLSGFDGKESRPVFNIIAPDTNTVEPGFQGTPFTGAFDGNSHTISNLTIEGERYLGLFGQLGFGADVKDLGVVDVNVTGTVCYIGGLAGFNHYGSITACYATGSVNGDRSVGCLLGHNFYGTVTACYATGSIRGTGNVGELMGCNESGSVTACYATGSVIGNSIDVGGLVGINYWEGTITDCYSTVKVQKSYDGDSPVCLGGLVGTNFFSIITNCYATGSVNGEEYVGGLVGDNSSGGIITNCYATGLVNGDKYIGGLLGANAHDGKVWNSFWDIQTSGLSNMCGCQGEGGVGCDDTYGKTSAEMQTASTFLNAGWDLVGETENGTEDNWSICEGTNYPRLVWQIPEGDFVCPDGITIDDFLFFIEHWGQESCDLSNGYCQGTDLDQSGTVDASDFEIWVENWLAGL